MPEPSKYTLHIVLRSTSGMQVITTMTPVEVNDELFVKHGTLAQIQALNERDEPVTVVVKREQVDGFIIGPYHRVAGQRPPLAIQ